jgi:DNA (cytosine-5)-methyltransferase 1
MGKPNCIDLFSGIGGISLAIKPFVNTILYCEINDYCKQVLYERMCSGHLEYAPIHNDIKTLKLSPHTMPSIIVGGSPCQDVSSMGNMKGIVEGTRSGLFFEMMRLLDECPSINIVFLENVSNILKIGIKEVIEELTKRNFHLQWTVRSASTLGAPHVRARWFCLAVKDGSFDDVNSLDTEYPDDLPCWTTEHTPRITFKKSDDETYDQNWISRCQSLGNSVVPSVVRKAFVDLVKSCKKWHSIKECFQEYSNDLCDVSEYPENALIYKNKFYTLFKTNHEVVKHKIDTKIKEPVKNEIMSMLHFPTPRRGLTHPSTLTERSMRDLPTVLVNSEVSKLYMMSKGVDITAKPLHEIAIANVNYIEWLMGYSVDWTKTSFVNPYHKRTAVENVQQIEKTSTKDIALSEKSSDVLELGSVSTEVKKHKRYNGLHALMKDNPGKSIKDIAVIWKALSDEQKKVYSKMAKDL